MLIACPACATRYTVPDSAIGMDGRVLRCAKCRHSWFQDGPELAEGHAAPAPEPMAQPDTVETPELPHEPEPDAYAPATHSAFAPATDFDETPSSFAHEPPFRPRRSRARVWIWTMIVLAVVIAVAAAALAMLGVPDWLPLPRAAFAATQPDLTLNFPQSQQTWRPLANGNSFFNVSGSITNAGQERRNVPPLEIVLRDANRAIVYSLEAASPKPALTPGESESINQAIIDAPKSARTATIGWKTS